MLPHNVEKSGFHRGEYVGWDSQGERYRIKRNGKGDSWWAYPQTPNGIPLFYAGTLALVGLRLQRRTSISARSVLSHERDALNWS